MITNVITLLTIIKHFQWSCNYSQKSKEKPFFFSFNSGAGNYFRPRAILGFYFCLAGQINVKKAL